MAWIAVPSKDKSAVLEQHLQEALELLRPVLVKYPLESDFSSLAGQTLVGRTEVLVYPEALRQFF